MKKKDHERIVADQEHHRLLETDEGRAHYWADLQQQCQSSALISLLEETLKLDGDIIECGVFRGRSLRMISAAVKTAGAEKTIIGCDSFEGFPEGTIDENDTTLFRPTFKLSRKFREAGDVPDMLQEFFEIFEVDGQLEKGYFENTLPKLPNEKYCFLHIDCDTYTSHLQCLDILYDKLVPGGIVVFDDYDKKKWPGATKAIDEFFADRDGEVRLSTTREVEAWYLKKPVVVSRG